MLDSLSVLQVAVTALIIAVAYFFRGVTGFGSGLISIPLLALMLPLTIVVPIVGLLDYLAAVGHGIKDRRNIQWHDVLPLIPFFIIGVATALFIFKYVDPVLLSKILGAFIILFALYTLSSFEPKRVGGRVLAMPSGLMGGLVGALYGTGGPFYVIYLKLRKLDKSVFRATLSAIFLLDGPARIIGYGVSGFYNRDAIVFVAVALPIMIIGMYVGGHVHTSLSQKTFQRAISVLLIGSGVALLLK